MTNISFNGLGIAPKILEILQRGNFTVPTPIQHQSIPAALEGKDIMGIAQTGTGKTLAFGIPMLQRLAQHQGQGLVVVPTRELAMQVEASLQTIGRPLGLKTAVLIGGQAMARQLADLRRQPHIIIATPGRLIDHLQHKTVALNRVSILVLDEADRMLDMGFAPQIKEVLRTVPKQRQTMLFSATMPSEIVQLAMSHMKLPVRVEVAPTGSTAANVSQEIFIVERQSKLALLESILKEYRGSTLIFSRTKFGAKKITQVVRHLGHSASEIHSNRSLSQRLAALEGFKTGAVRVLVATDIASRGIDVVGIELVINFDLPEKANDYIHRIGRTGRANRAGHAISFVTPDQRGDLREIERLIRKQLPVSQLPTLARQTPVTGLSVERGRQRPHSSGRPFSRRQPGRRYGRKRF